MAKKDIHPDYHMIKIKLTNGTVYESRSTWGKEGDVLELDIDSTIHPAWTKKRHMIEVDDGPLARFKKRYGDVVTK